MAKDVDLSSREWRDMIFEGKNKEFGAYELRSKSDARHNRAMIVVVLFILAVLALTFIIGKIQEANQEILTENVQDEAFAQAEVEEQEEPEEEPEEQVIYEEPEIPEVLPEELLNTMQVTEISIVDDDKVENEVKTQEEIQESQTALGSTDFSEGTDDLNVVREHKDEVVVEEKTPVFEDNHVFTSVEQMPVFPGGDAELLKYISSHIRYPDIAAENGIQGRVVVQFVVQKDGSVGQVKVARSKDPDLDKEAVRVVKTLPKFTPGRMNGQPVNVWYTLPVTFKLAN